MEEFDRLNVKKIDKEKTKLKDMNSENAIKNNFRKLCLNNLSIISSTDNLISSQNEKFYKNEKNNYTQKTNEHDYYTFLSNKNENKITFKSKSKIILKK